MNKVSLSKSIQIDAPVDSAWVTLRIGGGVIENGHTP